MTCPLCNKTDASFYAEDKNRSYSFCSNCSLVFVPPQFHLSKIEEKKRYDQHQNNPKDKGYQRFLMQLLSPLKPLIKADATGLDFGAGPSPALAALVAEWGIHLDRYDPFYANQASLLTNTYDVITSTEVLEHVHHPAEVFTQLRNMLNPNAYLGIMTKFYPSQSNFKTWWYKNDATHVCFYSLRTMQWIAHKWDLELIYQEKDVTIFRAS